MNTPLVMHAPSSARFILGVVLQADFALRRALNGHGLVIVRTRPGHPRLITIRVHAPGLESAEALITSE